MVSGWNVTHVRDEWQGINTFANARAVALMSALMKPSVFIEHGWLTTD